MGLILNDFDAPRLSEEELSAWRDIPVAIVGDELNRAQVLHAGIRPLRNDSSFIGQAMTVRCMAGDNLALHHAVSASFAGSVLMVDGRGYEENAVWGGVMQTLAKVREVAAVVVDGAVRDSAELKRYGPPVYARAVCAAGPHKGFGGEVNGPIQCGGTPVNSGDLILGDEDGVIVIHHHQLPGLLERCRTRLEKEAEVMAALEKGVTTVAYYNLPGPGAVG